MNKNILKPLGFDEKTEKVYRSLLSLADATAQRIAKESGIKRTSVYHILEHLIEMGAVSFYAQRGVRRFVAENPQKLKSYFEQKVILASRIIPELQKDIQESKDRLQIRILEGREAIKSISEEALETEDKTILSIGSSKKLVEFLGGKYGFGERRRKRGIVARSLRFEGDEQSTDIRFQKMRFLPKEYEFPGFFLIYHHTVGIMLFDGIGYGCVIRSKLFSKMMRSIFEILWLQAR